MMAGSGGGVPKATVQDLVILHQIDRSSPNLMTLCLYGKRIKRAVLTMRKSGGLPLDFCIITMEDVIISSVEPFGSAGGYYEQLSLSFAKIKQEYVVQNSIGGSMCTKYSRLKTTTPLRLWLCRQRHYEDRVRPAPSVPALHPASHLRHAWQPSICRHRPVPALPH